MVNNLTTIPVSSSHEFCVILHICIIFLLKKDDDEEDDAIFPRVFTYGEFDFNLICRTRLLCTTAMLHL